MSVSVSFGQSTPAWRMVWADEFSQADGSAPAPANWTYDVGGNGWGNSELETYTSRRENSRIQSGALIIEARRELFTGTDGFQRSYTSARLKTLGRKSWQYGRIESRMKVPRGQGLWPAFWMMGTDISSAGWPECGEIDIMENVGRQPGTVYGTIHGPGYSGSNNIGTSYTLPSGAALADDFHLFAVEWETNRIRWSIDNKVFFTVTPAGLPAGETWVFNKPFFILLNLAVGGVFPGNPDATTVFPQILTVDYVRAYARTNVVMPELEVQKTPEGAKMSWPGEFPHATLQRTAALGQAWQNVSTSGAREGNLFVQTITAPGFYRMSW